MSQKTARTSRAKGNLVERIAAMMHEGKGIKVETQVKLPPKDSSSKKTPREIDVLITASVSGYKVQIAIECKNEKKPIEAGYIDAFIGKLDYLRIPRQQGVYISVSPYTKGAKERAEEAGIKLLNLTGLTEDRFSQTIFSAVQSVIHVLLEIRQLSLTNSNSNFENEEFPSLFFDSEKQFKGTMPDLVWRMWRLNMLPTELGEYDINVEIPEGWIQYSNQLPDSVVSLEAKVKIIGIVINIDGKATMNSLIDADDNSFHKGNVSASFTNEDINSISLQTIETEEELKKFISDEKKKSFLHVTIGKLLLPKIRIFNKFGLMYWPPSPQDLFKLKSLVEQYPGDTEPEQSLLETDPFECRYIERIWEPIAPEFISLIQRWEEQ